MKATRKGQRNEHRHGLEPRVIGNVLIKFTGDDGGMIGDKYRKDGMGVGQGGIKPEDQPEEGLKRQ